MLIPVVMEPRGRAEKIPKINRITGRNIKSQAEIALMRKAGRIAVNAHREVIKTTRPGMHEYELAALFRYMLKKEGAQDLAYETIVCSGENHPYLHYYKHDRVLEDGDFLVIDAGPDYHYYDIDITVSFPANGKFSARMPCMKPACGYIGRDCPASRPRKRFLKS